MCVCVCVCVFVVVGGGLHTCMYVCIDVCALSLFVICQVRQSNFHPLPLISSLIENVAAVTHTHTHTHTHGCLSQNEPIIILLVYTLSSNRTLQSVESCFVFAEQK